MKSLNLFWNGEVYDLDRDNEAKTGEWIAPRLTITNIPDEVGNEEATKTANNTPTCKHLCNDPNDQNATTYTYDELKKLDGWCLNCSSAPKLADQLLAAPLVTA